MMVEPLSFKTFLAKITLTTSQTKEVFLTTTQHKINKK
jgi:hypothetical protein